MRFMKEAHQITGGRMRDKSKSVSRNNTNARMCKRGERRRSKPEHVRQPPVKRGRLVGTAALDGGRHGWAIKDKVRDRCCAWAEGPQRPRSEREPQPPKYLHTVYFVKNRDFEMRNLFVLFSQHCQSIKHSPGGFKVGRAPSRPCDILRAATVSLKQPAVSHSVIRPWLCKSPETASVRAVCRPLSQG